jgi:hypothetical protein
MDLAYKIPGAAVLIAWLLAAALYAVGWYRVKSNLNQFGDSLGVVGLVTAAGGAVWLAWDAPRNLALVRSSLTSGLAVSALVVYVVIGHRRRERLSALAVLAFAILIQAMAVGQLFAEGAQILTPETYLPLRMPLRTLIGLAGYGGLAVSATMVLLISSLARFRQRLSVNQLAAGIGLRALEWKSWQTAVVALSISVSIGLIRAWWGTGQVMLGGNSWALVAWLLLAASAIGLMQGATRSRLSRVLVVLACAAGVFSVLTMAGPLVVPDSLAGTG